MASPQEEAAPAAKRLRYSRAVPWTEDKARGSLAGVFLGDALGAPCEELAGNRVRFSQYPGGISPQWYFEIVQHGCRKRLQPGQGTDDSEMTAAALSVLASSEKPTPEELSAAYHRWANTKPAGMGNNTGALWKGYKNPEHYRVRCASRFGDPAAREREQSNGHLMRSVCYGLVAEEQEALRLADQDCCLSNPSSVCRWAERIYIRTLRLCLATQPPCEKSKAALRSLVETERDALPEGPCRCALQDALAETFSRAVTGKGRGWTLHALSLALHAVCSHGDFRNRLEFVLSQGGDTDTNGAIAGGLLGAYWGECRLLEQSAQTQRDLRLVRSCQGSVEMTLRGKTSCVLRPPLYSWSSVEASLRKMTFVSATSQGRRVEAV